MKIGIVTYYDVVNYGSALLAYSMQKYLVKLGHQVEFLKYHRVKKAAQPMTLMRRLRRMLPNARKAAKAEAQKQQAFADFRAQFLNIGPEYHDAKDLDLLIVGSDQIFDCKYEFNDYQFAVNTPCEKIIAYAPSFGEVHFSMIGDLPFREALKDALCGFSSLSARDENTKKILEHLTGKEVPLVLDPVLLYGFDQEMKCWNKRHIKEDYLVIYSWGGITTTEDFQNAVRAFARKAGLKTVSVGDRRPWCDYDFSSASPVEFFELIMHSSMVITNMFHGTCFSILHNRPFYSFAMPHNQNKILGILHDFSLESQLRTKPEEIVNDMVPQLDYNCVNASLLHRQDVSTKYLLTALNS